jgi:hypothetical protein
MIKINLLRLIFTFLLEIIFNILNFIYALIFKILKKNKEKISNYIRVYLYIHFKSFILLITGEHGKEKIIIGSMRFKPYFTRSNT